jgi:hypothetical protein
MPSYQDLIKTATENAGRARARRSSDGTRATAVSRRAIQASASCCGAVCVHPRCPVIVDIPVIILLHLGPRAIAALRERGFIAETGAPTLCELERAVTEMLGAAWHAGIRVDN